MNPWKRKEQIGDCTLSYRTGHSRALRMYPEIGPCVKCGDPKSERHHKDRNTLNNNRENIVPLCRRCHTLEHGKTVSQETNKKGRLAAAKLRRDKTHCPAGHSYSGDNLYTTRDGRRICKECNREAKRRYRARGGRG